MKLLTTIKYQPNDREADIKLKIFVVFLVLGGILALDTKLVFSWLLLFLYWNSILLDEAASRIY